MLAVGALLTGAAAGRAIARRRPASRAPIRWSPDLETPAPDEPEIFARIAAAMGGAARAVAAREGRSLRAGHAKAHAILKGELHVLPGLPPELAQGLFRPGARYPVLARMAQVPGEPLHDRQVSMPRGLAIKIFGVRGPALPGHAAPTQDLLFDSGGPSFTVADARLFLPQIAATQAAALALPHAAKAAASRLARMARAALDAIGVRSANLDFYGHRPLHPLGETYFTQAPLRHGAHVAKLRVSPANAATRALAGRTLETHSEHAMREAVAAFFAAHAAEYILSAQLCTDPRAMPIENAHRIWPERLSPYRPVARLVFPPQDPYGPARRDAVEASVAFSPAHSLEAHRPLGSIQRARLHVYEALNHERRRANGARPSEPRGLADIPD